MAEITMTLQEFNAFQQARFDAEAEAARLREQLATARLADPTGVVPALVQGLRAARAILPLSMMFVPRGKFPVDALVTFANVFERLPDATEDDKATAIDLRDFAKEVADGGGR